MTRPAMKRIKFHRAQDLSAWLRDHRTHGARVMVVTVADRTAPGYLDRGCIAQAATAHGWRIGTSYTLNGGLRGTVIAPPVGQGAGAPDTRASVFKDAFQISSKRFARAP